MTWPSQVFQREGRNCARGSPRIVAWRFRKTFSPFLAKVAKGVCFQSIYIMEEPEQHRVGPRAWSRRSLRSPQLFLPLSALGRAWLKEVQIFLPRGVQIGPQPLRSRGAYFEPRESTCLNE